MQDGIIIKALKDHAILFANESGCTIVGAKLDFSDVTKRMTGDWLNVRRFSSYDLSDEKDPFLDGVSAMAINGTRISLNEIADSLQADGIGFSDEKIYKVMCSKEDI